MSEVKERLRFALFTSFAPAGPPGPLWDHPSAVDFDYMNLTHWARLAQALEMAKFDAIFWADHSGVHDVYKGSYETAVRESVQFPLGDPVILSAALASATSDLALAFSANVIQDHPYSFARKVATLDHLTNGRVGWNIVTSFQPSAWRNLGYKETGKHSARYDQAEEFVTVVYKLLEGSWDADAVVRDTQRRIYADPTKVHNIEHEGSYYTVPGIGTTEPSPQRIPLLFQAGSSEDGRAFAARNAECMFLTAHNVRSVEILIEDMSRRLTEVGRLPTDLIYFIYKNVIVGATEEEARRKERECYEYLSSETDLAFFSSMMGFDLATVDLDTPIGDFKTESIQGQMRNLMEGTPDKSWTFRDIVVSMSRQNMIVGTPDQIADEFEMWQNAGIGGMNVGYLTGVGEVYDFIDLVVPVLQKRGLMQTEYQPGTAREKMFAHTASASGPRLNDRHPAAQYRKTGGAPARQASEAIQAK